MTRPFAGRKCRAVWQMPPVMGTSDGDQ